MRLETFVTKLYHLIRDRRNQVVESTLYACDSWDTYQNLVGQLKSLDLLEQEIKDLLKKELDDDVDITRPSSEEGAER
jgi:hypothetical protein